VRRPLLLARGRARDRLHQRTDAVEGAATGGQQGGERRGRWHGAQLPDVAREQGRRADAWARQDRARPACRAVVVPDDLGERAAGERDALLVLAEVLRGRAGAEQRGDHRAGRGADQHVGLARLEPLDVAQRTERPDHPRAAEHATAAEDDSSTRSARGVGHGPHLTVSDSSRSASTIPSVNTSTSVIASRSALRP
jgi:hypothetical protein